MSASNNVSNNQHWFCFMFHLIYSCRYCCYKQIRYGQTDSFVTIGEVLLFWIILKEVDSINSSIFSLCNNDAKTLISLIRDETTSPSIILNDPVLVLSI